MSLPPLPFPERRDMRHMVLPMPSINLKQHIDTELPEVGAGPSALEVFGAHRPEKNEPACMERILIETGSDVCGPPYYGGWLAGVRGKPVWNIATCLSDYV